MNWRDAIIAGFPHEPQKAQQAQQALKTLEDALQTLRAMGHPLHIEEGPPKQQLEEWPKWVFHLRAGQRVVRCQAELDELGPDWHPTMEAARLAAGLAKQYQRGGIFDRSLPSLDTVPAHTRQQQLDRETEEDRQRTHALALEARAHNRRKGNGVAMPGTRNEENR